MEHNRAHLQTMAAVWRQLPGEATTLTDEGALYPTANPFAVAFFEDLHLFAGLSGAEDFFELWRKTILMISIFDDEDVGDSFQRTDFKLVRTAAFSNKTLWDTLTERTIPRFDRDGVERDVCELEGENGRCGLVFTSKRQSVITNQCVNCGSTFADRPTAQNHVVNSRIRGTCKTNRSHVTWALEEVTFPISCNLCVQEVGDMQTYYTHVRLTHLPFPAPTIRENRYAQPARQPRRHRQHSISGDEREPRVHQEGRQPWRGRAKAASTNRQPNQAGARRRSTQGHGGRQGGRAGDPQQDHAQGHPQNASDDERPLIHGVGHAADQGFEARGGQHAEADANLRRESQTRGERTHTRPAIRVGILGPGQVSSAEGERSGSKNGTGHNDPLGSTGTAVTKADLRRGAFLQAGQNIQSRHQENHAEHRFSGGAAPRSRSTQPNRVRAQIGAASVPGRSSEDVKIIVRAFLTEKKKCRRTAKRGR